MVGCKFGTENYRDKTDSKLHIIENVTARVDEETGEQFFAPSTVERLQEPILGQAESSKGSKHQFMSTVGSRGQ